MVGIPDRFPYVVYQLAQTTAVHTVDLMAKFNKYISAEAPRVRTICIAIP